MKAGNETTLVRACLQLLRLRGVWAWRSNTGAARLPGRNGRLQLVRFGQSGISDILGVLPGGRLLAVEAKVGRNRPTPSQAAFLQNVRDAGGIAVVVRSLDDLIKVLDENIGKCEVCGSSDTV